MGFFTTRSLAALAATTALLVPVQAQTYTSCNPLKKTCPADEALGSTVDIDFTSGDPGDFIVNGDVSYGGDGVELAVSSDNKGPYMQSKWYMMFGRVDVTMKAAPGGGVVSSFILQSDDLDEIDLEWVGTQGTTFQTNFFGKGFTGTFNRGKNFETVDATGDYNTYSIDWNAERIQWIVNGDVLRTVTPDDFPGQFPQSPMFVKFGPWAAGDPSNNPKGTVQWADGPIDFGAGPYPMYVQSITAADYSTGTQYKYTDTTGTWQSIEAVGGEINEDATEGSGQTSSAEPSKTTSKPTSKPTSMTTSVSKEPFSKPGSDPSSTTKSSTPTNASATNTPTTAPAPDGGSESTGAGGSSNSTASTAPTPTGDDTPASASSSAPPENGVSSGKEVAVGLSLVCALFGIVAAF